MKSELLAAILAYYRADTTLQTLLVGTASLDVKIAYTLLPPVYPSVTFHIDDETPEQRAGYDDLGVVEIPTTIAVHNWAHDEGVIIGGTAYDAVMLQTEITERLRILSLNIDKDPTIYAIANLRESSFNSTPLPFEEDTHVHHTRSLLRFTYAIIDSS